MTKPSNNLYQGGNYSIEKLQLKSKYAAATIVCQFYHFDTKDESLGFVYVNGVLLRSDSKEIKFNVWPGEYRIEAGFPGKKWTIVAMLKVARGESILIKFYLEDDDRPLDD